MRLLDSQAARWLLKPAGRPASLALRLAGRITSYVASELERFAGGDTLGGDLVQAVAHRDRGRGFDHLSSPLRGGFAASCRLGS